MPHEDLESKTMLLRFAKVPIQGFIQAILISGRQHKKFNFLIKTYEYILALNMHSKQSGLLDFCHFKLFVCPSIVRRLKVGFTP